MNFMTTLKEENRGLTLNHWSRNPIFM